MKILPFCPFIKIPKAIIYLMTSFVKGKTSQTSVQPLPLEVNDHEDSNNLKFLGIIAKIFSFLD